MKQFIIEYYNMGIYSEKDLELFVLSGDITEQEKKDIIRGIVK